MPNPRRSRRGRGRGRGAPLSVTVNPVQTSARARGRQLPHRSPRYRVVHFDVPTTDGREIISVDSHGLLPAGLSGLDDFPVIPVGVDIDGNYFTEYRLPGEPFESLDQLIHAAGVHLLLDGSCHDLPQHEEQQHVVGSTSSQVPAPELQHLNYGASRNQTCEEQHQVGGKPVPELKHLYAEASSDLMCQEQQHVGGTASSQMPVLQHLHTEASCDMPSEELVGQAASSEMLQEQDFSSLKNFLNTATVDGLSVDATSSSSVQSDAVAQDTIEVPPPPWRCLSSLPIWVLNRFKWGYTFYIRNDLKGFFHTYPRVGGPFQSLQEANSAIDCYLEEHRDTMFMDQPGISRVEKVVRNCLYWPDGQRKRGMESQRDERRDCKRQLVKALVDKYNEYNHLMGDVAYQVKDVVRFKSIVGSSDPSMVHYHINFTMKTKGADDSTCVIDDLFFAEVTFKLGQAELVVSCFCTVKPTDNGCCHGCDVKHPNDAAAYTGAQVCPLGECANLGGMGECANLGGMEWKGYYETLEEEEARVRRLYEHQGRDDPDHVERRTIQA